MFIWITDLEVPRYISGDHMCLASGEDREWWRMMEGMRVGIEKGSDLQLEKAR